MHIFTGDYRVDYYDQHNELILEANSIATSLMQAHEKAKVMLFRPSMKGASYTIMRCVFNSIDTDNR